MIIALSVDATIVVTASMNATIVAIAYMNATIVAIALMNATIVAIASIDATIATIDITEGNGRPRRDVTVEFLRWQGGHSSNKPRRVLR